jgi:uncharacterized protein
MTAVVWRVRPRQLHLRQHFMRYKLRSNPRAVQREVELVYKPLLVFVVAIVCVLMAGCNSSAKAAAQPDRTSLATGFVQCLAAGNYADATASFDAAMLKAMPPDQLKQMWQSLLAQNGAYQSLGATHTATEGVYEIVFVPCAFEKVTLDFKLVFNQAGLMSGLWLVPHVDQSEAQYTTPDYVHSELYTEHEVTVGTGAWQLPGTLALPNGAGPFPAVVLVHGSGPNDRDETLAANKPFRDLAQGLASQGVAVLRYDKRTKVYAAQLAAFTGPFTVQDEVIDDALAAVELLRHTAGVDPKRIFVLGHSLGGMLIPRIGQAELIPRSGEADPPLAGLIVMAGPIRPLEDLMLDQMLYLASLSGTPSADADKQLDEVRRQIDLVKSPQLKPETPSSEALGAPGSYWLDLRGYDPAAAARALSQPLLILQGGRDYQVTQLEYAGWQQALKDRPNVSFKLYPDLNHLFMTGTGMSTPAEYDKRGPVAQAVIDDIAAWIKLKRLPMP